MPDSLLPPKRALWQRLTPLGLLAGAALVISVRYGDYLSFEALAAHHQSLSGWARAHPVVAAAIYIAAYAGAVALSLPGAVFLTLAGGLMFGLFPGALYILIAATLGATGIFAAARIGFGDLLGAGRLGRKGQRLIEEIRRSEISYLLLMRLVPMVPFFVANIVPALAGVGLRNFVLTTFVGIIPGTLVYTWVGAGLGTVIARGEAPGLDIVWSWPVLGPLLGLSALAALPIVLRALRGGPT